MSASAEESTKGPIAPARHQGQANPAPPNNNNNGEGANGGEGISAVVTKVLQGYNLALESVAIK
jgi:hypothetical protein